MSNQHQDERPPEVLSQAIKSAWDREAVGVTQFGLTPIPAQITQAASGWAIPVTTSVATGNAYELARVLDRLHEHIESESKLWVTLFLDPFADQHIPFYQSKKAS